MQRFFVLGQDYTDFPDFYFNDYKRLKDEGRYKRNFIRFHLP